MVGEEFPEDGAEVGAEVGPGSCDGDGDGGGLEQSEYNCSLLDPAMPKIAEEDMAIGADETC